MIKWLSEAGKFGGQNEASIATGNTDRRSVLLTDVEVFKARQKRGVTKSIRRELKRRNAIEPIIGHMKNDGLTHRNYLKGAQGDAVNVILMRCGTKPTFDPQASEDILSQNTTSFHAQSITALEIQRMKTGFFRPD